MQQHLQNINNNNNKSNAVPKQAHGSNNGNGQAATELRVQELICPRDQQHQGGCYVVMDGPSTSEKGFNRFLLMEPAKHGLLGEVALKFPILYNFTREYSRHWPVLANRLQLNYQRVLVAQPFITQTFAHGGQDLRRVPDGKTRRILCLGLHASAVNNFFANLSVKYDVTVVEPEKPLRYVAEKWFGFEENEHHRIFVDNPAFYVTARAQLLEQQNVSAAKKPKHFDFIVVDVCNGLGAKVPGSCPTDEFLEEKMLLALSKNLADNGTIVAHFFIPIVGPMPNAKMPTQLANIKAVQKFFYRMFKKFFTNCYFVSVESHSILTCNRRAAPLTRGAYMAAFHALPKELQIFPKNQEPVFILESELH